MSSLKNLRVTPGLAMKSVIFYERPGFLVDATARLQRIGSKPGVNACWTVEGLQTNTLQVPALEQGLIEAGGAHLVVLPATQARTLPLRLRQWLERWAELRQIHDAALAVIDDGTQADFMSTVSPELTRLVLDHGLNLIIDEVPVARNATEIVAPVPQDFELPLPHQQPRSNYAITGDSFRGFGINE